MNSSSTERDEAEHAIEEHSGWGWFIILGALLIALGLFAFVYVGLATVASILMVGMMMVIGGIAHILLAFRGEDWKRFLLLILGGILYLLAGAFVLVNPLLASSILTLIIAFSLLAAGGARVWFGFWARSEEGRGWIVATGVITFLLGLAIAAGWPVNSLWLIGMFLAVDLFLQGWSYVGFGLALRARASGMA